MRVALVGGSGFVGLSVARRLKEQGVHVTIIDREYRLVRNKADVTQYRMLKWSGGEVDIDFSDQDTMIYLASGTLPSTSMTSIKNDAEVNILPALTTFESAMDAGVRRIIFASSGGTVYGVANSLPVDENHVTRPISAYGVSKLAIEQYLGVMTRGSGVKGISLRISNPYGPYQFRGVGVGAIARFMQCATAGRPIQVWGDGTVVRDYLHIDDVANAFSSACMADPLPSGEYNIGSGQGISLNDILEHIAQACSVPVSKQYLPSRTFDVPAVVLNYRKFEAATGWLPKVSLQEGLRRMRDYLQNGELPPPEPISSATR